MAMTAPPVSGMFSWPITVNFRPCIRHVSRTSEITVPYTGSTVIKPSVRGPAALAGRSLALSPAKLGTAEDRNQRVSVQVTSVGHAGFRIDTPAGSILCDPWVNPAYFASWFPFPDNSGLDWDALGNCDYLYVSHLHQDPFDAKLLTEHVNKDATVLLPDYPGPDLKNALQRRGFHHFFEMSDSVKHRLSGPKGELHIRIPGLRAPADGPCGQASLGGPDGVTT